MGWIVIIRLTKLSDYLCVLRDGEITYIIQQVLYSQQNLFYGYRRSPIFISIKNWQAHSSWRIHLFFKLFHGARQFSSLVVNFLHWHLGEKPLDQICLVRVRIALLDSQSSLIQKHEHTFWRHRRKVVGKFHSQTKDASFPNCPSLSRDRAIPNHNILASIFIFISRGQSQMLQ